MNNANNVEIVLENLEVIKLNVTIWSARKKLREEDLILADGSKLPPDELASLGSMRLVGREHLKAFDTLKSRAEALCLKFGTRFLGGFAVPTGTAAALATELNDIRVAFEAARQKFLGSYEEAVNDWVGRYPDFAAAIRGHIDSVDAVGGKIGFDYCVFRVSPSEPPASRSKADALAQGLERSVEKMGGGLFGEIAREADDLLKDSLLGKDQVTRKALSPLKRMRDKLDGLSFLDYRVGPLVDTLDGLLRSIPPKGLLEGEVLQRILTVALLLSDPDRMRLHGEGLASKADFGPLLEAEAIPVQGADPDGAGLESVPETVDQAGDDTSQAVPDPVGTPQETTGGEREETPLSTPVQARLPLNMAVEAPLPPAEPEAAEAPPARDPFFDLFDEEVAEVEREFPVQAAVAVEVDAASLDGSESAPADGPASTDVTPPVQEILDDPVDEASESFVRQIVDGLAQADLSTPAEPSRAEPAAADTLVSGGDDDDWIW